MVYMYHSFLIHSSAGGHLGYFHVPAIVNGAGMNNEVPSHAGQNGCYQKVYKQ